MHRIFLILFFLSLLVFSCNHSNRERLNDSTSSNNLDIEKLQGKAAEAIAYCEDKNLNTNFFILIDLSRHSGLKRFFIWDLTNNQLVSSFLVSHGCCDKPWSGDLSKDKAQVSNRDGSHCSSIGKYILGERGYSNWGIHVKYLMHGQESTNSNALSRNIVFHSWEKVSDEEVYPTGTPEGWGCPAISNNAMRFVDSKLTQSEKPVLMWVIN